ncbi:hypothetical protein JKI95_11335 [Corynebacterium aquatimens]|uniref:hypothetical protein n=1 Tax=Corynebacterium aquatimens TaxID=1190508 RepID=UPI00254175B4|nr:hypothetical protein [Corynebacterium aquatimens]QYH19587.1 hypothetical protein JKI95_11335 [Corynebacterium aquatimens]
MSTGPAAALPPGTEVPYEAGYASQWRSYQVVKLGDPNYRNKDVRGIRVIGKFDQDWIMCHMNAKGGLGTCYVDGQSALELGYAPYGKVVTVDPMVKPFAPVLSFFIHLPSNLAALSSWSGSSYRYL